MTESSKVVEIIEGAGIVEASGELSDHELACVSGGTNGKPNPGKMNWEHYFDKASPVLMS